MFSFSDDYNEGANLRSENEEEVVFFRRGETLCKFINVCPHRGAKLFFHSEYSDNITCKYHAATFDSGSGHIMNKKRFDGRLFCDGLVKFENLTESHGLVFGEGLSVPKEVLSLLADAQFTETSEMFHKCASELLIENVLEIEHVTYVHPETFVPLGLRSHSPVKVGLYDWGSRLIAFESKKKQDPVYQHYFVEPNLFVSLTKNQIGYIAYLNEVSLGETTLRYKFFSGPELKKKPEVIQMAALKEAKKFTQAVLLEDKPMVEGQQRNLIYRSNLRLNGANDERIVHHRRKLRL
jgi:phenylpropionate dioxygenase-like ring-hydroxylating dioxygenase large terminal subunit